MADPDVLVVTSLDDVTADLVITALHRRGVPVVRVDPADIGDPVVFSARVGAGGRDWSGLLSTGSRDLDLGRVRSVYWRRPSPWRFDRLPGQARAFATAEARHGLGGLLAGLPVPYANHQVATQRAEFKPVQLQVAAELGFTVPATLITNDLAAARRFVTDHAPAVYKAFRGVPPAEGRTGAIWTQRVEAADLDESISVTAHLFQAEIVRKTDVRVTVVGRRVFASRIETPGRLLDWRSGDWDRASYGSVDVPEPITKALHAYLDRFGLVFGCFDLAISDGRWHWIECNPNGQWGFLPDSGDIADAFADLLQAG